MSQRFFNRELSWIEFNARVLAEAQNAEVPLLERLKFLSIVSSNFDEFFMVRAASLKRAMRAGQRATCPTGMSNRDQLKAIGSRVHDLVEQAYAVLLDELLPGLAAEGLERVVPQNWTGEQYAHVKRHFRDQVFPILTPVRAMSEPGLPMVGNHRLHAAFLLEAEQPDAAADAAAGSEGGTDPATETHLALVPVPPSLGRIVFLPSEGSGRIAFTLLEQVILSEAYQLFPGYRVVEQCLFRVTRDADLGVDEGRDEDFVEAMEQVLETRDRSFAVRLHINQRSQRLRSMLTTLLSLDDEEVYETPDPIELKHLMEVVAIDGFDHLRDASWQQMKSPWIDEDAPVWESVAARDIILHHPYESFDPVVRMVNEAADDRETLAIKMTLYRTSGSSPIVRALERAAENGKQVSVLVELKARFDEERNIAWAERLERAGVIVVYGVARLKVHAKALMIVRRERGQIRRYVHLSTGNYNEKTARLYTDIGLLSADENLAYEVGLFFNAITGYSVIPALSKLVMAPHAMKTSLIERIEREAARAEATGSGLIIAKLNSLADPEIIEALYQASRAGVRIRLNVRGICMLVPGVPDMSESIEVVSVVDRYLEHSRLFWFENGGSHDVFLSSADWMPRNLDKRVELLVPIENRDIHRRIRSLLDLYFSDTRKAHRLKPDGSWVRVRAKKGQEPVRAQEACYERVRQRMSDDEPENRQEFPVRRKRPRATKGGAG